MTNYSQQTESQPEPAFQTLRTVGPLVDMESRSDGTLILRNPRDLPQGERTIIAYLRQWADQAPDRVMLAERGPGNTWTEISYGDMRRKADAIAQWLIDRGLGAGHSVMILSGGSIEHAVLALGAMTAGVAIAPLSPAYSLVDPDHTKLRKVYDVTHPSVVFVQNGLQFKAALASLDLARQRVPVVAVTGLDAGSEMTAFSDLLATRPTPAVEAAYAATGPDTVAKILFTSGSTGWPKGVINTQRMLCLNMAMTDAYWEPAENTKPNVTLNWMPWNHTMGGNGLFNRSLRLGGTFYIDNGRPLPGDFDRTLANLREISPHSHSDVPAGYAMLATALEADDELRQKFFKNLNFLQYAGASLPMELWQRFQRLAVRTTGKRIVFLTGYGCTEAGPLITQLHWPVEGSGYIGLPLPGVEVKLIPVGGVRYELRARGRNIFPGYLGEPELTAAAFDEEGFYKTGDAVSFVDQNEPVHGLRFAGRVVEDFKLLTGTSVTVSMLRATALGMLMPLVRDLVITGHDRAFVGALAWPELGACRRLLGEAGKGLGDIEVMHAPQVTDALRSALAEYNRNHDASSTRIQRLLLLEEPPSTQTNEITDKGYINQRSALENRAAHVERLYAEPVAADVIVP